MGKSTISMGELRLCWKPAFMFVRASTPRCAFEQTPRGGEDWWIRWWGEACHNHRGAQGAGTRDLGTRLHQTVSKVRKIQNIWKYDHIISYELTWIAEDFGGFFIRTLEFAQNSGNLARVAWDDICEDSCEPEEWNPNEFLVTLLKSSKMIPCLFENLQSVKLKG